MLYHQSCIFILQALAALTCGDIPRLFAREKQAIVQSSIDKFMSSRSTSEIQGSVVSWSKSYDSKHPKQQMLTECIIHNVIVMCGLPVSIIDHPNFRHFLHDFDSKYSPPCQQTATNSSAKVDGECKV